MFDNFPECRLAAQIFDFETWNGKSYMIILKFVLIFNIFSNSSLIYGLVRTNQLRRFSNRLFFALSVNGLVAGSLAMVSLSTSIFVQTEGGCQFWSRVSGDVLKFYSHAEDLGTTMLALDRLIHIRCSWKSYIIFSKKKALVIFLIISYSPGLMLVLVDIYYGRLLLILLGTISAFNLTVFFVTNLQLIIYIRHEGRLIWGLSKSFNRTAVYQRKATNTILCITSVYSVCKLPVCCFLVYNFITLTWYPERDFVMSIYFLYWALLVQFMNSILNALIFTLRNKTIMKFYRKKFV